MLYRKCLTCRWRAGGPDKGWRGNRRTASARTWGRTQGKGTSGSRLVIVIPAWEVLTSKDKMVKLEPAESSINTGKKE